MSLLLENYNLLNDFDMTEPLEEAYYGKLKEFDEIEKNLEVIIKTCKRIASDSNYEMDINNSKQLHRIEMLFEKAFQLDEFHLTFYSLGLANNAFTIPQSFAFLKRDPKNKKLVDPNKIIANVSVDIGLIAANDLTVKEVMGLILHEIGHCFDASFVHYIGSIADIILGETDQFGNKMTPFSKITSILTTELMKISTIQTFSNSLTKIITSWTQEYPSFHNFIIGLERVLGTFADIYSKIASFHFLKNGKDLIVELSKGAVNPLTLFNHFIRPSAFLAYGGEKRADSFATAYGYGEGLSSALAKLENSKHNLINDVVDKIPILSFGNDFLKTLRDTVTTFMDPHPKNANRLNNQLNKLKRDIHDPNLSPSVKKEIQLQIDSIESMISKYFTSTDVAKQGRVFTFLYNYILIRVFKGKLDIREIISGKWNEI